MRRAALAAPPVPGAYTGQRLPAVRCTRPGLCKLAVLGASVVAAAVVVMVATAGPVAGDHDSRSAASARVPVAAWGLVSGALGRTDPAYRAAGAGAGFVVRNPRQRLRAEFSRAGVTVRSGQALLGLRLRGYGYGYGSSLRGLAAVAPTASANRVLYHHGPLSEWYANGPLGLEQGFTLTARPAGRRTGPLTLALALSGNARAVLSRDLRAVTFSHAGSSVSYRGLVATDARGRTLHSWLTLRGRELLLRVDDVGARYPLRVDPVVQQAELTASDLGGLLGASVAISGKTIVAGAPEATVNGNPFQGAVYVFVKPRGGWADATQTARLTASDGAAGDGLGGNGFFGVAWFNENDVGISGDTVVAGAVDATVNGNASQGAVYVWVKPKGGWRSETQQAKLTASDGAANDKLGNTAAISGHTVVAGAIGATVNGNADQGAVYVWTKPEDGWRSETQHAKLTASDGAANDFLGGSLAIQRNTIVAGAPTQLLPSAGAAYVFVKPKGGWSSGTETAELTASNGTVGARPGANGAQVGWSVAIDGGTVAVGAPCETINGNACQGAAYVFLEPKGGWRSETEAAELTASDGMTNDNLGLGVAVSRQTIVAGAPFANGFVGYADVFVEPAGGWHTETQTATLTASDGGGAFGWSTAMSGQTLVIGAYSAGNAFGGAAYVFTGSGTGAQTAAVKRSAARVGLAPLSVERRLLGTRASVRPERAAGVARSRQFPQSSPLKEVRR
jgi:hypothetical protein